MKYFKKQEELNINTYGDDDWATPVQEYKMKVIFCIPGNSFSNRFIKCWTKLQQELNKKNKYYKFGKVTRGKTFELVKNSS